MFVLVLASLLPQSAPSVDAAGPGKEPIRVALTAKLPEGKSRLRWSPKGASVPLTVRDDSLVGSFALGPEGTAPVAVELSRSEGGEHYDQLAIDCDRDGVFSDGERLTSSPRERRKKWWTSFEAVVQVEHGEVRNPYPMALWFVFDPREPDAPPRLRWSRRGWHEGSFPLGDETVHVLITESAMDGVFTARDSWQLGLDRGRMLLNPSRQLSSHNWLGEQAYRITSFEPDGSALTIEAFDPGITRAEEKRRNDTMRADRQAKRAAKPLAFGHDYAAALAEAARTKKRVLVDFETTWCGPCKMMNRFVYTTQDVVTAAADVICVKVDGDEHRELVKKHEVKGYPTMLLLDDAGNEIRREVGYRSVKLMVEFLKR